jgi:hypothetical protein
MGIIILKEPDVGWARQASPRPQDRTPPPSLRTVVGGYKSAVARRLHAALPDRGVIWQRNYYEHVIRDGADLARVRPYICENPLRWEEDPYFV